MPGDGRPAISTGAKNNCSSLVIVCCHAIYKGGDNDDPHNEKSWHLKSFQKSDGARGKRGEHETFVKHILQAARLLEESANTFAVFSGGRTDAAVDRSEAQSYSDAFRQLIRKGEGISAESAGRIFHEQRWGIEEEATDSFQNLLFSILQFRRAMGRYPERITVVTHAFKTSRFIDLHAAAIRWPREHIAVIGIDPEWANAEEHVETTRLEAANAIAPFQSDPYGMTGLMAAKRIQRQWHPDRIGIIGSELEPEVQGLLEWSGPQLYANRLPWT